MKPNLTDTPDRESNPFFHTYKRLPLDIDRGEGAYLITKDGTRYLDLFAGIAVNALGYGHSRVLNAIHDQASKYIHLSNYFLQEPQLRLAHALLKHSGYQKVFFTNSGTEATEGAIKIARKWGASRGKNEIVAFSNGFHGRTMGALSIIDRPKYRDGYEPFLEHCRVLPFNDCEELRRALGPQTLAVVLEFIQGEGGIRSATVEFVRTIEALQQEHGFLLVADEIQSGLGRTGKLFSFQHFGAMPDIVLAAKPLGGGLPLGAILGNSVVADVLQTGTHGSTFGGNPVACAAGIVVLEELMERGVMENAEAMGDLFLAKLASLKAEHPWFIRDVRGIGLMIGIELSIESEAVAVALREKKVLVNATDKTVLRIVPPLIITSGHVEEFVQTLRQVIPLFEKRNANSPPVPLSWQRGGE